MKKNRLIKYVLIGILGTGLPILFLTLLSMVLYGANFPAVKYYYWRGFYEQRIRNLDNALLHYDKASQLDSTFTLAYISRGSAYMDLKEYNKAITNYSKAISLEPDNEEPYAYRGRAYYEIDSLSQSKADYDKAIALNKDFVYAYSNRALLKYTKLQDFTGACEDLKRAAQLGDEAAKTQLNDGICE